MLLKLPKEILFNILGLLTFKDKLNLVRTCRHLKILISERHLYEELPTFKKKSKLQDALDLFKNCPIYGSQVRRIHIKTTSVTTEMSMQLPSVFPNIKEFRTDIRWLEIEPGIKILQTWKDTLELFHGESDIHIDSLLRLNTFSRLSSLTMSLPGSFFMLRPHIRRIVDDNDNIITYIGPRFLHNLTQHESLTDISQNRYTYLTNHNLQVLDCFKNTPSLRHLKLRGGYLHLQYFEKLHVVCPQLTSLSLSANIYVGDIDALPSFIEPATQLRSLKLDMNSRINNTKNRVLDYLISKYTNLTKLIFLAGDLDDETVHTGRTDQQHDYNLEESIRKRSEFISSLPSTIKILKLNTFVFEDPVGALQESALDPIELALCTTSTPSLLTPASVIINPSHFNYIQNLKSLQSLTIGWNSIMENNIYGIILDRISNLTVQIPIEPSDTHDDILVAINSMYPSLKCLKVTCSSMCSSEMSSIPIKRTLSKVTFPNLRKLSLDQSFNSVNIIEYIRTSFPNMKELELKFWYNSVYNDGCFDIHLEGYDLDILNLAFNCFLERRPFVIFFLQVKTLDNVKNYEVKLVPYHEDGQKTEITEVGPSTKSRFRVICDGIKMLKVNDMDTKPLF